MTSKTSTQEENVLYDRYQGKNFYSYKSSLGGDKRSGIEKEMRENSNTCYKCGKEGHIKPNFLVKVTYS